MTTRILLAPVKLSIGLVKLELRIVRGVARIAYDLRREGARDAAERSRANGADGGPAAAPTPLPDEAPPPRPRTSAARRKPAAPPKRSTPRKAAAPRRSAVPRTPATGRPERPRTAEPTPGEVAAVREALREAETAAPAASVGPAAHAGPEIHVAALWDGYDAMALDEVLARIAGADAATLAAVRLYEGAHGSRQPILLATETP